MEIINFYPHEKLELYFEMCYNKNNKFSLSLY